MYKINHLTVINSNTQEVVARPKRNRNVKNVERYRELEKKRYKALLDIDVEIDLCYTENTEGSEQ